MALTIEGATIGYNANEVQNAINNLNVVCVQETIKSMNTGMADLRTAVDAAWVGRSAEQFKTNMETDMNKIASALQDTFEVLKTQMYEIVTKMDEMDENLVKGRGE